MSLNLTRILHFTKIIKNHFHDITNKYRIIGKGILLQILNNSFLNIVATFAVELTFPLTTSVPTSSSFLKVIEITFPLSMFDCVNGWKNLKEEFDSEKEAFNLGNDSLFECI